MQFYYKLKLFVFQTKLYNIMCGVNIKNKNKICNKKNEINILRPIWAFKYIILFNRKTRSQQEVSLLRSFSIKDLHWRSLKFCNQFLAKRIWVKIEISFVAESNFCNYGNWCTLNILLHKYQCLKSRILA